MAVVAVGTDKGGYILRRADGGWSVDDPLFPGWRVTAFGRTADGTYLAGTASGWFGPAVHRSSDLVEWTQVEKGPAYPEDGPELQQIWTFTTAPDGRIWCGVAEAGLFISDDDGTSWQPVAGLNEHRTRDQWQPGAGGMCAHSIIVTDTTVWAAASAIGVFRSDDGGADFEPRNIGLDAAIPGGEAPEVGYCVHRLVADADEPKRMWQQNHTGVYRSLDGGDNWQRCEEGLPAGFGFPIVRDHSSGRLFVLPLTADVDRTPPDGRFAVHRSDDDGDSWHRSGDGWPEEPMYDSVLRGAMDGDGHGTVALGTTGGQVWTTTDAGDTWSRLPGTFPRINTVAVL